MCSVTISTLADFPETLPILAEWFHGEWHSFDERSIAEIEAQLGQNLNRNSIPITFVAHRGSELLGSISLDLSDLPPFDHLSPWLASLFVHPNARGAGVGSTLIRHAVAFASERKVDPLHLWTSRSTRLFKRCGWEIFDRTTYASHPITIMRFSREFPPLEQQ